LLSALVVVVAVAFRSQLFAQARYLPRYQEPDWFTFRLSQIGVGAYAEGEFDTSTYQNPSSSVTHQHVFVGPSLILAGSGSIYHPNFLTYNVNMDGAFGYAKDTFSSSSSSEQLLYLGTFSANIDLLANKPYHAGFFANYDHTYRDNDFFNRVIVDSWRYGGRVGYTDGAWSLLADYAHRTDNESSLTDTSSTTDDVVNFNARNDRTSGGSSLNYTFDEFRREDLGQTSIGNDHSVSIADVERFGSFDQSRLNTIATYLRRDTTDESSEEMLANMSFNSDLRPNLKTFDDLDYDHYQSGTFKSDTYTGQASLQHQLYESLVSTLTLRGTDYESSDARNSGYNRRYGGGFSESYTKRTSETSRLHINNFLFLEHTDQQTLGTVQNERHQFSESGAPPDSFFLNQPNVIELTIQVTDDKGTLPAYVLGLDYTVSRLGSRTLIQRIPGSRIAPTATVLVDYHTIPTPQGSYNTITEGFQIRYDLWDNLLGVYGRINLSLNDAPADLLVQDVEAYTVGTDLTWSYLRLGAEYELYYSTESDYRTARLFQSLAFHPDEASSLSFDFSETWIDYVDNNQSEQDYRFITRYHRALTHRFSLETDAGIAIRRGNGVDQFLAAFRPSVKYVIGKTSIDAGYDYEYELFLNSEERQRQLFFLRLKRMF
jgi:hypothetical protein